MSVNHDGFLNLGPLNMLTYEQWDTIADVYIPLLLLLSLCHLAYFISKKEIRKAATIFTATVLSVFYIYAWMFLDQALLIWPSFSVAGQVLDYSTHTALAWVFVCQLIMINKTSLYASVVSMVLYLALMLYQQYHSIADMVTTTAVVLPILYVLQKQAVKPNHTH